MSRDLLNKKILEMQDEMIKSIQESIQINSVLAPAEENAPYGVGCKDALMHILELGKSMGFKTDHMDYQMGWIEYGEGEEMVGVLGHMDVVPEGDGWIYPAFGGEIHDGKIWGRGVIDDKGPTIGALYGLKAIRDLGLPIDRRIRILVGTNEENGHKCAIHYKKNGGEIPTLGFTPDADFPAIFYEKGISRYTIGGTVTDKGNIEVESLEAGTAVNVVIPHCKLVVNGKINVNPVSDRVTVVEEDGKTIVEAVGIGAHGSAPHKGINAALLVLQSVKDNDFGGDFQKLLDFVLDKLGHDTNGEALGVFYDDEDTGKTTCNFGMLHYDHNDMSAQIEIRYPKNGTKESVEEKVQEAAKNYGLEVVASRYSVSVYCPKDSELITKLMKVYQEETGDMGEAISIGGGTYAKEFKNMVAFGPVFPGDPDVIHQPNEYAEIDKLVKAIQITTGAMWELAKK